jgi:predicted dithiol-disulfide oxidoreductase (DUF899 family)
MRILQVIHGYPMRFNAGSEVYTQALAQGLADRHTVRVFTRHEDPFTQYDSTQCPGAQRMKSCWKVKPSTMKGRPWGTCWPTR